MKISFIDICHLAENFMIAYTEPFLGAVRKPNGIIMIERREQAGRLE
jgi:hypothetical protein